MFSSIGRSAAVVSLIMLLLVGVTGGIGYWSAKNTERAITDMQDITIVVQRHMQSDMKHDSIRADVAAALAALDPSTGISMKESLDAVESDSAEFLQAVAEAKQAANDPAVRAVLDDLDVPLKAYIDEARNMQRLISNDPRRAPAAFPAFEGKFSILADAMGKASETIESFSETASAAEAAKASRVQMMMVGAIIASVVLLIGLSLLVRRVLISPLIALGDVTHDLSTGNYNRNVPETGRQDELGIVARGLVTLRDAGRDKVALEQANAESRAAQVAIVDALGAGLASLRNGDFTKTVDGQFGAEYAMLQDNFNHAVGALREMMQIVNAITDGIRTGSENIAQSADELARRTEGNAASLEETSAALIQIDSRLKTSATASQTTVTRAGQASSTVDRGREIAGSAVAAMVRVRDSAKSIDDVIEGLDKIAFQTRVLAMNAAVEAGRAGEAGRGFAVVADLVSALAIRAEEEAKRARDQLSVTQAEVVSAVSTVEKVDGALAEIAGDVGAVHALLQTMATDNVAQAHAVTEISAAVANMDQATQKNAAVVEETAAAARNLNSNVNTLVERAAIFNFERRKQQIPVAVDRRAPANTAKESMYLAAAE